VAAASLAQAPAGTDAPAVLVDPGDDAAAWLPPPGLAVVQTQDALVEGIDFRRDWTTPHALGMRALAVALSDLAAMGAQPHTCLATVCAPAATVADDLLAIQLGILDAAAGVGCRLLGGDVSAIAGPLVVDVSATGSAEPARLLRRDAGHPGDLLAVTGVLGRAAAGLRLLDGDRAVVDAPTRTCWLQAQLAPRPRLAEGRALAAAGIGCAGDLSDGLLVDSGRIAAASGCAAVLWLEALPVDAALKDAFAGWPELALGGGEDFELLAAAPAGVLTAAQASWPAGLAPLSVVGRLAEGTGLRLLDRDGGRALPLPAVRSRHFA